MVVHPKTCTYFSGFSVVLKDSSYMKDDIDLAGYPANKVAGKANY